MVDSILAQINADNRMNILKKDEKREETKMTISNYQNERGELKRRLAEEEKEQEEAIASYNELTKEREVEEKRRKREEEEDRKRTWKKVAEDTQSFKQSRDDYNDLRDFLYDQERQEREKAEAEEKEIKHFQLRDQLLRQNMEQIEAKKKLLTKMEEEEKEMVKQMLAKFDADEEDEKRKQQSALDSKYQYVSEARRQREEREQIFKAEIEQETKEVEKQKELDAYKEMVIAEARKCLLEKHAAQLKGFLPKGGQNMDI